MWRVTVQPHTLYVWRDTSLYPPIINTEHSGVLFRSTEQPLEDKEQKGALFLLRRRGQKTTHTQNWGTTWGLDGTERRKTDDHHRKIGIISQLTTIHFILHWKQKQKLCTNNKKKLNQYLKCQFLVSNVLILFQLNNFTIFW